MSALPQEHDDDAAGRGVLFAFFYRHILRSNDRSGSFSSQEGSVVVSAPPSGPLRILAKQEAQDLDARCRFCFDGVQEEEEEQEGQASPSPEQDYRLVAPCRCIGSSEYVHIACLRQWQRHAVHSTRQTKAASICSVCTSPYALRPLTPRQLRTITAGTLLVSKDDGLDAGIFNQSVVLLLHGTEQGGLPFGVIINKAAVARDALPGTHSRKGGPVCGGRLGILRYMVLHTTMLQGRRQDRWVSKPVFEGSSQLQLLHDSESLYDRECSALLEREQLVDFQKTWSSPQEGAVFVFTGYCSWGRGQLEREVQRDVWHLCHGTEQDVSGAGADNLWETLTHGAASDRLIPTEELYE